MSTLARSVDQLEQPMQALSVTSQHGTDASTTQNMNGENVQSVSLKHADGTETSVYVQLDHMSGQFLPFNPPPIPQPFSSTEFNASTESGSVGLAQSEEAAIQQQPQTRIYKAMFTLEETIDEHGNSQIKAHSPQLLEHDAGEAGSGASNPQHLFLARMAARHRRMLAISVKRQRKLKMKKKKYKKLMKRTRNERRKLDRL
ncbi:hypothetical protein RRF57_008354 [Xylaria bambusicola]|uniref:Small ribosomal subunit protein mS38 n=1 Tax=Xylaria bambusicola TaxID=326684 RepID=A0AAN7UHN7_9PEZI